MDEPAQRLPTEDFKKGRRARSRLARAACAHGEGSKDRGGPAAPGTSPGGDAGRSFNSHFGNPVGGLHDRSGLEAFLQLVDRIGHIGFARIVAILRA